ncbi:uncharacterized protein LOC119683465 isoform X2 [Teleopsis dalmanni]|uniref:uncharacterized protein LOC119683465 isoform X2 n=1 Tax=Teleopsis dalmanni TaxID=139649 RepID=UPI0018CDD346|nr:uncharacterized protein LOC119683465 isoform X2 [Teleopsis dalmanni]
MATLKGEPQFGIFLCKTKKATIHQRILNKIACESERNALSYKRIGQCERDRYIYSICERIFGNVILKRRIESYGVALKMLFMIIVVIAVITENTVSAAQRDSFKLKDPNSISNNGHNTPKSNGNIVTNINDINSGNTNNGNAFSDYNMKHSNSNAEMSTTSNVGIFSSSNRTNNGKWSTTTTTKTTTTLHATTITSTSASAAKSASSSSISIASGSLQKGSSSNILTGNSGINRNSIDLTDDARNGPYFDKAASKNVTALLGKTAYLNCRVKNLGNKTMLLQVSWVRHRDIHLLTVGRYTYTSDQRFRAIHQPQTEDWLLQIKYPQHRDSGIYECQVSTTPHMSHYIHLNVVEPSTEIVGAPDLYIESGSTINLTCVILNSPEPPAYIYWNHNSAIINYDSPRGGVSVVTNKGDITTSFLLIKSARTSDSGLYQCNPSNAKPRSVTVHVLNGEFPAAMQRAGPTYHRMSQSHYIAVYLLIYLFTSVYARQYMQLSRAVGAEREDAC